ncbi:hypothetical protein [Chitinophaga alhagiae]|uniref:hypothetical protein n=1 Tax=Chitinophaga alhagiae TaxID=2203219 RepID=UPI000E5C0A52|nr:hypothetical protein [Chitinophaga alhagiae]
MKKIMILMAAAMITAGGIFSASAQEKATPAPVKTEQAKTGAKHEKKAHKSTKHVKHAKAVKKAQK